MQAVKFEAGVPRLGWQMHSSRRSSLEAAEPASHSSPSHEGSDGSGTMQRHSSSEASAASDCSSRPFASS